MKTPGIDCVSLVSPCKSLKFILNESYSIANIKKKKINRKNTALVTVGPQHKTNGTLFSNQNQNLKVHRFVHAEYNSFISVGVEKLKNSLFVIIFNGFFSSLNLSRHMGSDGLLSLQPHSLYIIQPSKLFWKRK